MRKHNADCIRIKKQRINGRAGLRTNSPGRFLAPPRVNAKNQPIPMPQTAVDAAMLTAHTAKPEDSNSEMS